MSLKKCFITPIRTRTLANLRIRPVHIDQAPGYAADGCIGKARHDRPQSIWLIKTGGVGKENDFAARLHDCGVLRRGLPKSLCLTMKLHVARSEIPCNLVSTIRRAV